MATVNDVKAKREFKVLREIISIRPRKVKR